ncbi:MAG: lycopene cyclase family protein [Winogradskyella arenosi]
MKDKSLKYDYIIAGAGASGLLLAYRLSQDPFFSSKSILIVDKEKKKDNDRTWCYWESGVGPWDALLTKTWHSVYFGSATFSKTMAIAPYRYKMIRSAAFYELLWKEIDLNPQITFVAAEVEKVLERENQVQVITPATTFYGAKLFTSIPNPETYKSQTKFPLIHQHFVGWFIETTSDTFDDSKATMMDFAIPQKGNTRFIYVLPLSKRKALIEYTLFSKSLLAYSDYEKAIVDYLTENNITDYTIVEKEQGNIPMTSFDFNTLNSKHILHIGTAGGWTKASTGYTFQNTVKKTKALQAFLKQDHDLRRFHKASKFRFYDLIFLDVLAKHNGEGAALFSAMFKKAHIKTIFKFLDEESSYFEDLKIILSVPPKRFIQAFFKRLF